MNEVIYDIKREGWIVYILNVQNVQLPLLIGMNTNFRNSDFPSVFLGTRAVVHVTVMGLQYSTPNALWLTDGSTALLQNVIKTQILRKNEEGNTVRSQCV
jgi:hypothetical protein